MIKYREFSTATTEEIREVVEAMKFKYISHTPTEHGFDVEVESEWEASVEETMTIRDTIELKEYGVAVFDFDIGDESYELYHKWILARGFNRYLMNNPFIKTTLNDKGYSRPRAQ